MPTSQQTTAWVRSAELCPDSESAPRDLNPQSLSVIGIDDIRNGHASCQQGAPGAAGVICRVLAPRPETLWLLALGIPFRGAQHA